MDKPRITEEEVVRRMVEIIAMEHQSLIRQRDHHLKGKIHAVLSRMHMTRKAMNIREILAGLKYAGSVFAVCLFAVVLHGMWREGLIGIGIGVAGIAIVVLYVLISEQRDYRNHCHALKFLFDNWINVNVVLQLHYHDAYKKIRKSWEEREGEGIVRDMQPSNLPTFWQMFEKMEQEEKTHEPSEFFSIPPRATIEKIVAQTSPTGERNERR